MSTVIRYFIGFALLRLVIGPESSLHYLNQSEQKLKPLGRARFPALYHHRGFFMCVFFFFLSLKSVGHFHSDRGFTY